MEGAGRVGGRGEGGREAGRKRDVEEVEKLSWLRTVTNKTAATKRAARVHLR